MARNIIEMRKKEEAKIAVRLRSDLFQTCVRLVFEMFPARFLKISLTNHNKSAKFELARGHT